MDKIYHLKLNKKGSPLHLEFQLTTLWYKIYYLVIIRSKKQKEKIEIQLQIIEIKTREVVESYAG